MIIFVGSDHNGYDLKDKIIAYLKKSNYEVVDNGDQKYDANDDFPVFAQRVSNSMKLSQDPESRGILICGSGQGMCMAANRIKGIRACLCWNLVEARASRNDDDANVLCLSATSTSIDDAEMIVQTWLATPFSGAERFKRRLNELDEME